MTRLTSLRRTRADLMARSALCSALTSAFGVIATSPVLAATMPSLPVQAPTMPQVAGGAAMQPTVSVTGATMTVGTNASRTLIDWNSFTVANGSTVNFTLTTRSDIVLNRLVNSTPVMINGAINSTVNGAIGGNVWFSAPGGVVFGSTAVVNVGGMLATTALVDVNSFLNTDSTSSFPFTYPGTGYPGTTDYPAVSGYPTNNVAGGVGGVTVMNGAKLTAQGGLLALIAPFVNVAAGATVQSTDQSASGGGAGSVLYGAANAFTVSLSQETSGDLDMLQFVIDSPSQVTDTPLLLQGATTGTNVYLAALSASGITGAVVDATGTLTATKASTGQGGEIILSTGADTITPGQAPALTAQTVSPLDLSLDTVTAGASLQVLSSGAINASADPAGVLSAAGDLTLTAGALTPMGGGNISLATAASGGTFTATALNTDQYGVHGIGAISANSITAAGSIDLEGSSVTANSLTAGSGGGLGGITATASDSAYSQTSGTASVDIGSASATGDITLTANDGYASLTNVAFNGSGQTLSLTAYGFDPSVGYDPTYLGYSAGGPGANNGAGPTGGVGAVSGPGAASAAINLSANGDVNVDVSGAVTLNNLNSGNNTINLTADSLTVTGTVQAYYGINATARTGDLNGNALNAYYGDVDATATQGSVSLTSAATVFYGDVNVNAPQGSVFLANASASNIYVTAGRTAHVDNATTFSQEGDPIDVTGATAYLGTANSQDDINVTATNGNATAGDFTALGAVTVKATNGVASLHSASLSQNTGYPGGSSYPNTVAVTATGTGADVLIGDPVGVMATGFVTGATSVTAQADEDVTVNVSQPIELNMVSAGRNVSLTAPSLTLDSLQGNLSGTIGIDVTADAFSYTSALTAGGGVTIAASGGLTLGDVTAQNGDIALTSTATEVSPGSGALVTVGTGPISVGAVKASGALSVAGLSVTASSLTASSTADVEADAAASNTGATSQVDVGTLQAGGAITLVANNGYASITNLALEGTGASLNLTASGAVYLGYASGGTGAGAGSGSITGSGPISLTGGGDVDVDVPGSVTLASVDATSTTANLTADSLSVGTVSAARGINLTANTGDLNVTNQAISVYGDNAINATATMGDVNLAYAAGPNIYVTAAGLAQVNGADNTRFSSDDITRVIQVTGASVVVGGAASQNTFTATASNGSATVSNVTAGDNVTVSATNGSAILGDVTGQGGVSVTASNGVASLHSATLSPNSGTGFPNSVAVSATGTGADVLIGGPDSYGNVGFVTGATSVTAQADRDVAVNVNQPIELNSVSAGRTVSLTAPSLTLDSLQGTLTGDIGIDVTDAAFSYANPLTAGGGVTVSSAGALTLGAVTAGGGAISLTGGGVTAGPLNAFTSIGLTSTGGDIVLDGDATAQGSFTALAVNSSNQGLGAISLSNVSAGATINLAGSSVTAVSLTAKASGGAAIGAIAYDPASGDAGGAFVDVGSITTGGSVAIQANDGYASLTNATFTGSGQTLSLTSQGGAPVYVGYSPGGPGANGGAGPIGGVGSIGGPGAASATLYLSSAGDANLDVAPGSGLVTVGSAFAGGAVNLTADALTLAGKVESGFGGATVTARTGDLNAQELDADFGDVNASATRGSVFLANTTANNVYVTAAQTAHVDNATTTAQQGDPIDVTGAVAYLGAANSQDDINLTATNGSATAGDLTALGAITIKATNGVASLHSATLSQSTGYPGGSTSPNTVALIATGTGADVLIGDPVGTLATGFVTGATSITAQADRDVAVNVDQPIELNSVSAGRTVSLTAPGLTLDSLQGTLTGDIGINVTDAAFSYANPLTAGGGVTVSASGALTLGDLTAQNGAIRLTGASIAGRNLNAAAGIIASGLTGDVDLGSGVAGSVIDIAARGSIMSDGLTAGALASGLGLIDLRAGLETAQNSQPNAAGAVDVGALVAGDYINIVSAPGGVTVASAQTSPGYQTEGWVHILGDQTGPVEAPYATTGQSTAPVPAFITIGAISAGSGATLTTAGALNLTGDLSSGGHVSLTGASVTGEDLTAGPITSDGQGLSVATTGGAVSLGDITSEAGALSLVGSSVSAGEVSSNGAASLTANTGALSLTSIASGGGITLMAPVGAITVASTLQANGGDALILAGGDIGFGGAVSARDDLIASTHAGASALALGAISATSITTGGGIDLEATNVRATVLQAQGELSSGYAITAHAYVNSEGANANDASVRVDTVTSPGSIRLISDNGVVSANQISADDVQLIGSGGGVLVTGPVSATGNVYAGTQSTGSALGVISVGSVNAGGGIDLEGTSVRAQALTAEGVDASGYSVTAHAFEAADGSNAGSASIQVASAAGPAGIRMFADDGALTLGSLNAGGTIDLEGSSVYAASLLASGMDGTGMSITANAHARGDGTNVGAAFVDVGAVSAPGNILLAAQDGYASLTNATFTGAGQTLTLASTGSPQTVYLGYGQGGVGGDGGEGGVSGTGAIELKSNGGVSVNTTGAISLDRVAANAVNITADAVTVNAIYANANAFGSTANGAVTVAARTGDINLGTLQAIYGPVSLTAPGAVNAGEVVGQGIDVKAGGAADIGYASTLVAASDGAGGAYSTSAPLQITGAQVTLNQGFGYGPMILAATNGAAIVGDIVFGGGAVAISAVNGSASLHSASLEGISPNASPLQTGLPQPAASPISITASGPGADVLIGGMSSAEGGLGFVSGAASLTASADEDVNVNVGGALALTSVQAGRNASVTADALTLGRLSALQDVVLTTPNTATAQLEVTPSLTAGSVSAGRDLTISSEGALSLGGLSAGRNLSLTGPSVSLATLAGQPSGVVSITTTSTGFNTSSTLIGSAVDVSAAGSVTLGGVTALAGNVDVRAQGAASVGDAVAASDIQIAANGGSATLHSASFTGGAGVLTLTASGAASDISLGQGTGSVQGAARVNLQAGEDIAAVVTGPIIFGGVQAGRDLSVSAAGVQATSLASGRDASVTSSDGVGAGVVVAGRDLSVDAAGGVVLGPGSIGRNLTLTGSSISLSTPSAPLTGAVQVDATGGDLDIAPPGGEVAPISAAGSVALTASGAIEVGALQSSGGAVSLNGTSVSTGDIAAAQSLTAAASGALQTGALSAGASATLTGGSITTGAVSAAGPVSATARSGPLTLASLTTPDAVSLSGLGVNLAAAQLGSDLIVSSSAGATLGAITVGGALALDAVGSAALGSVSVAGSGRITAADLDIDTLLSAPTLTIEARNGGLTVGGSAAPTDGAMFISEAEFSRLRASDSLALYAGSTTGTARGALTVSDLSLDPTVTPKVSLYAAPGQTVSVAGAVTPTVSGGALAIGSTTDAAWAPSTILVSGALGSATRVSDTRFTGVRAFSQVTLSSGGNVLIGSPRFFALVQATPAKSIDIARNQPSGVTATGSEIGKVYVATGQLSIDATGAVVQQNSSGSLSSYSGLYLLNGVSASKTALSIDPPTVVDLFGSFMNAAGLLESGAQASRGSGLQVLGLPAGSRVPDDYRFNGCEISPDAACGGVVGPEQGLELLQEQEAAAVAAATTDPQLLTQSVLLTLAPSLQIEEQLDPLVTGVGNEEIWRKRQPGEGNDR